MASRRRFDRFMVDVELGSNLKVGRFTDAEFRCLITGVWALAAKTEPRGCLTVGGTPAKSEDVARQARCSLAVAQRTIQKMIALAMLEYDGERDWYSVHDWHDVNPAPKHDPDASNRMRRLRERRRAAQSDNPVTDDVTGGVTRTLRAGDGHEVKKKEEEEVLPANAGSSAHKRATRRVDQSVPPDGFPDELAARLGDVLVVLHGVWEHRGGIEPQQRGVGLAMLRNPKADHLQVARRLEHWLLAGNGQRAQCKDVCARFGDWLADEPAAARVVSLAGPRRVGALPAAAQQAADAGDLEAFRRAFRGLDGPAGAA